MNDLALLSLEFIGAYGLAAMAFTGLYAGYLFLTRRKSKITLDRLASFALLSPVLWTGMSAIVALLGASNGLLPNSLAAGLYALVLCAIPATALTHSVIEEETRRINNNNSRSDKQ